MRNQNLAFEASPLYQEATELYRCAAKLTRTKHRALNDALRRHALRLLEHCAVAVSPWTRSGDTRSLRYAGIALQKLTAVVDAARIEEEITELEHGRMRSQLRRTMSQLEHAFGDPEDEVSGDVPNEPPTEPAEVFDWCTVPSDWETAWQEGTGEATELTSTSRWRGTS